jgi:tetratricopeptide (TPR) repeat protein
MFLSEEFGRTQGIRRALSDPGPVKGLVSLEATLFAEAGLAFDDSAHDWALGAGLQLLDADGQAGAERLLTSIPSDSPFAADAAVALAELAVKRDANEKAVSEAQRAVRMAPSRTSIALAAGGVLTRAGNQQSALAVFSNALGKAATQQERADLLIARAAANQFFGLTDSAVSDARAAVAADPRSEIKVSAIGILFEHGSGWPDAVKIGRELLAGMPDSVTRLNQLGYTLIQKPEGLDEGFKLLSRGAALGRNDYAVIDSLGWAYYQYGDFGEALRLVERADELSPEPNSEILDHLGDIYWRLGQPDAAKQAWERAMAAKPEALRRQRLQAKIDKGLTSPAPARRTPPMVERVVPGERTDL